MKPSSAGLVIIFNKKILLEHPTSAKWTASYSIPKGEIEDGENTLEAAIRETQEECGITIPRHLINPEERLLTYKRDGVVYNKIYYYVVHIHNLEDIGLTSEVIPKEQLQTDEVDWAGFLSFHDALPKTIVRQVDSLQYIHKHL